MEDWPSLAFESFGLVTKVRCESPETFAGVGEALPPGAHVRPSGEASATVTVDRFGAIAVDEEALVGPRLSVASAEYVLAQLEMVLRRHVARHAPEHIFIHAGVVGADGVGVVIPGGSMSGKSTLVSALVRRGATYYSDEYAVVDPGGLIHPYPKPLTPRSARDPHRPIEPVHVSASRRASAPIRPGLIVLTRYERGASWSPKRLSAGAAALALLENVVSDRSGPARAVGVVRALVGCAEVVSGARGDAELAAREIVGLLRASAA